MHKIYYFVLFFAYIGISVDCQGGGGSPKSSSSSRSHSRSHSHSYHNSHNYGGYSGSSSGGYGGSSGGDTGFVIIIFVVITSIIAIIYTFREYCTKRGEPDESNTAFVSTNSRQDTNLIRINNEPVESMAGFVHSTNSQQFEQNMNLFHSGIWSSEYKQYDQWHGPFEMSLTFNPVSLQVIGSGSDDVGLYFINGTYSHQTRRIALTKTYHEGTGNASQNLGHNVTIQLTHTQNSKFEGKWYVRTSEYSGEDEFVLNRKPELVYVNNKLFYH